MIYGLVDPRTGCLRYVGKTKAVTKRYSRHCHPLKGDVSHRACWVRGILNSGMKPELVVLEYVAPDQVGLVECFWIASLRASGADLVNICDGGEGNNRGRLGKKNSPEHNAKIRAAHIGLTPNEETRQLMSKNRLGRKWSDQHRINVMARHNRKMAP